MVFSPVGTLSNKVLVGLTRLRATTTPDDVILLPQETTTRIWMTGAPRMRGGWGRGGDHARGGGCVRGGQASRQRRWICVLDAMRGQGRMGRGRGYGGAGLRG
jgi:hypothetical protein